MKSNRSRLVVVLGFAVALPACAQRFAQIKVAGTGDACTVESVKAIQVKVREKSQAGQAKDYKDRKFEESTKGMAWLVFNQCDQPYKVEVKSFMLNKVPVDPPLACASYSATPDVGAFLPIACKVKDGIEYGHYKYSIFIGDKLKLDPEVIIKRDR